MELQIIEAKILQLAACVGTNREKNEHLAYCLLEFESNQEKKER